MTVELPGGRITPVYFLGGAREVSLIEVELARSSKPHEASKEGGN